MEAGQAEGLARSLLARFEMGPLENAVTFTLSRGEKQRLAIVAMLVTNPGFLVLDEPTTGLDSRRKEILGAMLRQLTGQNVGILLISHDTAFVKEYASRVYRMAEGMVLAP
jgi:energy-coupling factor transport system ATP-binding protein